MYCRTIKLLEENISRTFFAISCSNIFLNLSPRIMEIQTKINKCNLIKLKRFCTAKETINKMKRQPMDWEKIFANNVTNKGLISKIYKQYIQLNIKETAQSKNGQQTYIDITPKKYTDIQMANRHMTSYSVLLIIREIQIKTRISSHWSEWPSLKTLQIQLYSNFKKTVEIVNAGEGVERKAPFYTVSGRVNWSSH